MPNHPLAKPLAALLFASLVAACSANVAVTPAPSAGPSSAATTAPVTSPGASSAPTATATPAPAASVKAGHPTPVPGSLPFTQLAQVASGTGAAPLYRITTQDNLDAFAAEFKLTPVPTVDFATHTVLAVPISGGACQGSEVVGVQDGASLTVVTASYDDGCQNIIGPRPFYALISIDRSNKPVKDAQPYIADTPARASQTP